MKVETPTRGMSLERKLPLLMTAVLLVVLAAVTVLLDREARRAAEVVASNKARENAASISGLLAQNGPAFANLLKTASRERSVQQLLHASQPSRRELDAAQRVLAALENKSLPSDSGLVSELRSPDGTMLVRSGDSSAHVGRPAGGAVSTGRDSLSIRSFYALGGRVYYWTSLPIRENGQRIGVIAQTPGSTTSLRPSLLSTRCRVRATRYFSPTAMAPCGLRLADTRFGRREIREWFAVTRRSITTR